MMNNKIKIPRARLFRAKIQVQKNGDPEDPYVLADGEKLIFGVKTGPERTDYLLRKELTGDNYDNELHCYTLQLTTAETNIPVGEYWYDVALKRTTGELEKIIGATLFEVVKSIVLPEVS